MSDRTENLSAPTWASLRALSEECDQLRAERDYLRERLLEARSQTPAQVGTRWRQLYRITPQCSALLQLLYERNGRIATHSAIRAALWPLGCHDERVDQSVKIYVHRLRYALGGKHTIETIHGDGYRLTETGLASINSVVEAQRRSA